jgi:hypothetical protein
MTDTRITPFEQVWVKLADDSRWSVTGEIIGHAMLVNQVDRLDHNDRLDFADMPFSMFEPHEKVELIDKVWEALK